MHEIEFINVSKVYGTTEVIPALNLKINAGERLVLLGPSGCGKTTTLRMVAGLEDISGGELRMAGRRVNEVPPGERNLAMVFQNYALFPHLSVWENVTFGLQLQKLPKTEIEKRAKDALSILNLIGYEDRKPKELSGGQNQRVALCRAIVKQSPYFLLDEPLSNLDAQLRQQARTELVKLHERYHSTMIYVTHDQVEAMTVADRIAILNKGVLQQLDTPKNIYRRPANTFVASFIGTPPMNLFSAYLKDNRIYIGGKWLPIEAKWEKILADRNKVTLGIRPEKCRPVSCEPQVAATLSYEENLGSRRTLCLTMKTQENIYISTEEPGGSTIKGFRFSWEDLNFFDYKSGENIGYPNEGGQFNENISK